MKTLKRTWADISLDNLEYNYRSIRAHLPQGTKFLGVMKADAYGHGAVPVSRALADLGAEYLAVSNLEEAVQIRRGEVRLPILILGYTPAEYAANMIFLDITQEVHSLEYARELNEALAGTNYILNVHLKLDTGMTRIGFFAYDNERTLDELRQVAQLPHLHIEGVFMHFCVADSRAEADVSFTKLQYKRFMDMLSAMAGVGIRPEIRHCCNSGATILYPEFALDMVRPGIITYGNAPSDELAGRAQPAADDVAAFHDRAGPHRPGWDGYQLWPALPDEGGDARGGAAHRLCRRPEPPAHRQGELLSAGASGAGHRADLHGHVHDRRLGRAGGEARRRGHDLRLR